MKRRLFLIAAAALCIAAGAFARQRGYQLSSHILDVNTGRPASGVRIVLSRMEGDGVWAVLEEHTTDADGRVREMLPAVRHGGNSGIYKLTFCVGAYFEERGQESFYPFIEVVLEIRGEDHYHVPITLSPFGYSTYRGS